MRPLFDPEFDELAADSHANSLARVATGLGAGLMATMLLPWRVALAWTCAFMVIEAWGWFATRAQYLGRPFGLRTRLNYLAVLLALVGQWLTLAALYWWPGTNGGDVAAAIVIMGVIGFAQSFASRSAVGFAACGVVPAIGMIALVLAAPNHEHMLRGPVMGTLALGIGFALAGAQQTREAARKLKETRGRLEDSEQQYRVLADNITDMISRRRLTGHWTYASPSVATLMGYTPEEYCALDPSQIVHPEDLPLLQAKFREMMAGARSTICEHRLIRKDGTPSWVETSYSMVRDPQTGEPVDLIATSRDINHRKALEEDLIHARQVAEAAAAAKADFLANMTHELRTPLNAIVGFSGLLETSERLAEADARQVRLIRSASSTLLAVVNSVLDFSKLEAGAFEFDAQPFDPRELAAAAVAMVEGQVRAQGLYLRVACDGEADWLNGDAPRLQQVLLNLLGNALKFTHAGGIEVRLAAAPAGPDARRLRVEVADTGVGVPADKQAVIFERFSQADASVSRNFGGTGLGLAISRRIIELMGGRIGVSSVEGEGSTFWFELDLPTAAATAAAAPLPSPAGTGLDQPVRLLLVEDNSVNRELVQAFLEPFDVEIATAENGALAVEAMRRARYDVVLMDVQMPVMDGMTAARLIRGMSDPDASRTPIIAMTANVLPEQVQRCLDAGMDAHIGKPINPVELIQAVGRWTADAAREDARGAAQKAS